jgi:hypothetical protein
VPGLGASYAAVSATEHARLEQVAANKAEAARLGNRGFKPTARMAMATAKRANKRNMENAQRDRGDVDPSETHACAVNVGRPMAARISMMVSDLLRLEFVRRLLLTSVHSRCKTRQVLLKISLADQSGRHPRWAASRSCVCVRS